MKRLLKSRLSALALPCAALLCAVLLCAVLVVGCGSSGRRVDPYGALQTPGPPPAARSGAQVWAVGMPVLVVASADGGATWRTAGASTHGDPFTQILYAVAFADSRHGWAVGKAGLVVASSDGGAHWAVRHRDAADVCLLGVVAISGRSAQAVGYARDGALGIVESTSDAGKTWQTRYAGRDALRAVAFADARHGWAVGSTGILATTDGGAHWRLQRAVSGMYRFSAVTFADARHGWAVGGAGAGPLKPGFIMTTTDGGAHWSTFMPGTPDRLNGVSFVGARRGWVVGQPRRGLPHDRWRPFVGARARRRRLGSSAPSRSATRGTAGRSCTLTGTWRRPRRATPHEAGGCSVSSTCSPRATAAPPGRRSRRSTAWRLR